MVGRDKTTDSNEILFEEVDVSAVPVFARLSYEETFER